MEDEHKDNPVLFSTLDNPAPENHVAGYFPGFDGRMLRYAIFKSKATVARGTIVLLQGRNECIEKYYETIRHFTDRGLWVATFDWRGQGGSGRLLKNPLRGHVSRFSDLEQDLMAFLETVVLTETRLPFSLVAHSMGALVALSAAPLLGNRIDRMALAAPFVDLSGQSLSMATIRFISWISRLTGLGWISFDRDRFPVPFAGNVLTSDPARFERNKNIYLRRPDLRLGPPTASWILAMTGAMKRVNRIGHLGSINVPTILLAAGRDKIVAVRAIEKLANRFRNGSAITIDGARHELFQEADRYRIAALKAIDAFIPADQHGEQDAEASSGSSALSQPG